MKQILIPVLFILTFDSICNGQVLPKIDYEDKIRIREAKRMADRSGDSVWKGFKQTLFPVLLITDSVEFLIDHPYPSADFNFLQEDTVIKSKVYFRKRVFPVNMLATFPAVNGLSCVVVGTPANTNKNTTEWIVTLLHEHFHQVQFNWPDYFTGVDKLNLSGGDQTGMWQLNYNFPYTHARVARGYRAYRRSLLKAVSQKEKPGFDVHFKRYLRKRKKFKRLLDPADYRYFSFQIWQEGIARYTEYKLLQTLSEYQPSKEVQQLRDFVSFGKYKGMLYQKQQELLGTLELKKNKRLCFYTIGFAEGLLLDVINPGWKSTYFINKFFIEEYFKNDF